MNLPIRAIIIAARRMGATVFKIEHRNVYFKFNGTYGLMSRETILEYGA